MYLLLSEQKFLKVKIYYLSYKLIFIFFLISILLYSFIEKKEIYQLNSQFHYRGKSFHLTYKEINEFNSYINICLNGILIDQTKYNKTLNPKITVIIPVYNIGKKIYYSIRSIQNQRMKEIEIILINDASNKDTLNIIEKLKEEDPRIKIISNEINRRILYSKSIGALYSNGKYILELDQDDMFISDKAFNILYNEAEKHNVDLLQFRDFSLNNFKFDKNVKGNGIIFEQDTKIEFQPNIKNSMFKKYNYLLWGLLIKSDIYKNAVINYWPIVINYKFIHFEDFCITFLIVVLAKKFEYFNQFFMVHLIHDQSASSVKIFKKQYYACVLLFYNFIFDYNVKNNQENINIFLNNIYGDKLGFSQLKLNFPILFDFVFKKIFPYFAFEDQKQILSIININISNIKLWNSFRYFMNENEFKSIKSFQNLFNKKTNIKPIVSLNPKFSIIIYCNNIIFIENTIYSIENQKKFYNYEIILIYDNNVEKEIEYIKKIVQNYLNIKLLNNLKKRGLIYSYYKGILQSKGEYILTIKSGYTLAKDNVLYELNQNLKNGIEIIEFNLLLNNKDFITDSSLSLYKCTHFKSEINLDFLKFNLFYKQIDQEKELIINKLIKSNLYKKLIKEYKYFFIDNFINNYYDDILMFLIEQKNISIKHIDIFGIIEFSTKINIYNSSIINDSIYYINFLYDHSEDSVKGKKYSLNEFYNTMNIIYNKFNNITQKGIDLLNKYLKCDYISKYEKKNIITYFNALIDRNKYDMISLNKDSNKKIL